MRPVSAARAGQRGQTTTAGQEKDKRRTIAGEISGRCFAGRSETHWHSPSSLKRRIKSHQVCLQNILGHAGAQRRKQQRKRKVKEKEGRKQCLDRKR